MDLLDTLCLALMSVEYISEQMDHLFFYSGTDDDVMNWSWVKHSFARLQDIPRVEIWREDGVKHEDDGHFIGFFLLRVMPPPTVKEQLCAYDERDQKKTPLL